MRYAANYANKVHQFRWLFCPTASKGQNSLFRVVERPENNSILIDKQNRANGFNWNFFTVFISFRSNINPLLNFPASLRRFQLQRAFQASLAFLPCPCRRNYFFSSSPLAKIVLSISMLTSASKAAVVKSAKSAISASWLALMILPFISS